MKRFKKLKSALNLIDSFDLRLLTWWLIGCLLATVPQIIIDHKLTIHYRYGARSYPWAWPYLICFNIFVVMASHFVALRAKKCRIIYLPFPCVIATLGSILPLQMKFPSLLLQPLILQ